MSIIKTLFKTFAVVTTLSVAERFIGFLYRIILSRALGSESLGIYQIALSIFGVLVTITSSGIPLTVSRFMQKYRAENQPQKVNRVITAGIAIAFIFSLPVILLFTLCGGAFAFLFSDPRSQTIFSVMIPGLLFTSVYAVLRGVFWGNKDFVPYSIVELIEEIVMVVCGVLLVTRATDAFQGAKRAAFAIVLSYVVSFTLALILFFTKGGKLSNPRKEFRPLLSSALPITGMRTANSAVSSLIAILLPARLMRAGMTSSEALSAFGASFGMAIPLLFIPSSIIGSLALILVPELSENFYAGRNSALKNNVEKALRASILIAGAIVPVFLSLGKEIGVSVYGNEMAGSYLALSSPVMFPMCLMMISQSLLNSMGKEKHTLLHYLAGAGITLFCVLCLPYLVGAHALSIGFFISYTVTSLLNLRLLEKICPKVDYRPFLLRCVLLTIAPTAFGFLLKGVLTSIVGTTLCALLGGAAVFGFTAVLYLTTGTVRAQMLLDEFRRKPKKREQSV